MNNIYTSTYPTRYDLLKDHIYWSVGGVSYAPLAPDLPDQKFVYEYRIDKRIKFENYKDEVRRALIQLDKNRVHAGCKRLAICLSGTDSEVILREAVELGYECSVYHLNFWDLYPESLSTIKNITYDLNVNLNVISISIEEFYSYILTTFPTIQIYRPAYLAMPFLFRKIPKDELIITGGGDLEIGGLSHQTVDRTPGIAILQLEIVYRVWAQKNRRWGEYYFHSSTPQLVLSAYNDPSTIKKFPFLSHKKIYDKYWKLSFKKKTQPLPNPIQRLAKERLFKVYPRHPEACVIGFLVPEESVKV